MLLLLLLAIAIAFTVIVAVTVAIAILLLLITYYYNCYYYYYQFNDYCYLEKDKYLKALNKKDHHSVLNLFIDTLEHELFHTWKAIKFKAGIAVLSSFEYCNLWHYV